jgi:hypothetical protein
MSYFLKIARFRIHPINQDNTKTTACLWHSSHTVRCKPSRKIVQLTLLKAKQGGRLPSWPSPIRLRASPRLAGGGPPWLASRVGAHTACIGRGELTKGRRARGLHLRWGGFARERPSGAAQGATHAELRGDGRRGTGHMGHGQEAERLR